MEMEMIQYSGAIIRARSNEREATQISNRIIAGIFFTALFSAFIITPFANGQDTGDISVLSAPSGAIDNSSGIQQPLQENGSAVSDAVSNHIRKNDTPRHFLPVVLNAAAVQTSSYVFLTKWGTYGSGNGQLYSPAGMALDSSGNVYVADKNNHRIQKFNWNGSYITQWGTWGAGNQNIEYPWTIAIDKSNNVYVTDFGYDTERVVKYDSAGNYITKWGSYGSGDGQFYIPTGIATDSSGNVYVADYLNSRIEKFNANGTFITKWGSTGTGNGQFNGPCGVAVDSSGKVYVVDSVNQRIQKFGSNGSYISQWGTLGTGNGQFNYPGQIAIDSSDNLYVTDTGNYQVQKFNATGGFLDRWGSAGTADGQFDLPHGVTVASSGNVYVSDYNLHRIQVFKPILPVANFTGTPLSGTAPLNVRFTDSSTGSPMFWYWSFGDGNYSTQQNPLHTYVKAGTYTVKLTATNGGGSNTKTRTGYVVVTAPQTTFYVFSDGVGIYHDGSPPLFEANLSAKNFFDNMIGNNQICSVYQGVNYCWKGRQNPLDDTTGSKYWNKSESADSAGANSADFAFHAGHGNKDLIRFSTQNGFPDAYISNMRFSRAKWVALDSCDVLNINNWRTTWTPAFDGTHLIMGFDTDGDLHREQGIELAKRMTGGLIDGTNYPPVTIRQAWVNTMKHTINRADISGGYIDANPCKDDYLPGYGNFCTEPIKNSYGNFVTNYTWFTCS